MKTILEDIFKCKIGMHSIIVNILTFCLFFIFGLTLSDIIKFASFDWANSSFYSLLLNFILYLLPLAGLFFSRFWFSKWQLTINKSFADITLSKNELNGRIYGILLLISSFSLYIYSFYLIYPIKFLFNPNTKKPGSVLSLIDFFSFLDIKFIFIFFLLVFLILIFYNISLLFNIYLGIMYLSYVVYISINYLNNNYGNDLARIFLIVPICYVSSCLLLAIFSYLITNNSISDWRTFTLSGTEINQLLSLVPILICLSGVSFGLIV